MKDTLLFRWEMWSRMMFVLAIQLLILFLGIFLWMIGEE